ncbi:MAG TPA: TetR/AcrR family transcriptional regulator [Albitalea sp.]|nr:TetR/AcrR family transcriptional regulator [Albitalea sp.]
MPKPPGSRAIATPAKRRPKPQVGGQALSRDLIVEAALALVADEGLVAFSMRKLGQRLGCEAMSLYHHFPSKQHLLDALVDHAIRSIEVPEPGPDALERLRRSLYSYRAMARRWPALFPLLAVHRLNTRTGVSFIESILRLIRSVEPDPEMAARQFRVMGYYLAGAGLEETAGYARGPSAAEPVDDGFIGRHCPHLIEAAPYFKEPHWDATFDLGIELLLQGMVAARAPRRRGAGAAGRPA